MKLSDLIAGESGKASHTKVWNNVGSGVFTFIVLNKHFANTLSDDLLTWYGGLLIAGALVSKGVALAGNK